MTLTATPVPTGRQVRRYTAARARRRGGASIGSLLVDVYTVLITTAVGVGLAIGLVDGVREVLPPDTGGRAAGPEVSLPTLGALVVLALVGTVVSLAGRLGPVGVGGAEATWWLTLPVGRRALLRPAAVRLPLAAGAVGAVVLPVLDLAVHEAGRPAPERVLAVAAAGALGAAALVLAAGVGQTFGASRRRIAAAGDVLVALAPALAVGAAVTGVSLPPAPTPDAGVLAGLGVVVVAASVALDRRLDRIPARALRESGSVAGQAVGAVVSLDSRELGRALGEGIPARRRRRSARLRPVRSAAAALVTADALLLLRSGRHLAQLAGAACVPAAVLSVPHLRTPVVVLPALLAAGYVATLATAEGARRAEMAPVVDRLLPIGARRVRWLRMVVPGVAIALWSVPAFTPLVLLGAQVPEWVVLGLLAAPVWAGAAVRAAYRPAPDWGGPLVSTPAGALPIGAASVLSRGPDVVVLGLVPVLVAVALGTVVPGVLVAQALVSALVAAVCAHVPDAA
ncbi:DUF6297 family protein [Cellulomonas aerilata]|uniref:Uncharacterized protein n=1 Tax=Cellulomonas aerilata TaxID=515326 RepID=A0A512DH42_9CELL|nr:DUF6297 family protein [Cellulomonas aerilata]GEO35772.1 hypothetical protein CAE01nite_34970 [Cellulomonas aerilata]